MAYERVKPTYVDEVNLPPEYAIIAYGRMKVEPHSFLTLALDEGE